VRHRVASVVVGLSMVAIMLLGTGCAKSATPPANTGGASARPEVRDTSTGVDRAAACNAATPVTPRTDDTSEGAIAPARDGLPSGAPDPAHLGPSLKAHGYDMSGYLASMLVGVSLPSAKQALLCPDGSLFVRGADASSPPLKTGLGLVTLSGHGDATPYTNGGEHPLFWHPAREILGSRPCAALVNDSFGAKLLYAVDLDNLDPIQDKPAS
jgi:hypothetical protein